MPIEFAKDDERGCWAKLRGKWTGYECERAEGHTGRHAVPEMCEVAAQKGNS